MSKVEIISIVTTGMMFLIALRVPLGVAMFIAGAAGYGWIVGSLPLLNYLKALFWARFSVYDLSVIPLFLLMGQFASIAGFSRSLFRAANAWIGWVKGGVAQAAIVACACFGAISGSSVATAATMSQVVLPEMKRLKYSDRLATGTLAAGGTLGILVPPSFILIIYSFLAEQSIIKLFAAAVVPGLLAAVLYMISISIYIRLYPGHAPETSERSTASRRELIEATLEAWPIAAIFLVMFTGIYRGWFTATEGAAVGTSSTLLLGIIRGKINFKNALKGFLPAAQASAMIYTMLLGAAMMNTALAVSQVPADLSAWANSLNYHPLVIVGGFLVLFVILSCILDELAMMLLLLPVVLPTILGLDLFGMTVEHKAIWFGILMLVVVSVGLIAPPVGLAVYVVANIAKNVPIGEIYRGIVPFLISDIVRVLLLLFFPALTLFALRFVS
jgi:tripartite ATP-independent transporter DctM subunit